MVKVQTYREPSGHMISKNVFLPPPQFLSLISKSPVKREEMW